MKNCWERSKCCVHIPIECLCSILGCTLCYSSCYCSPWKAVEPAPRAAATTRETWFLLLGAAFRLIVVPSVGTVNIWGINQQLSLDLVQPINSYLQGMSLPLKEINQNGQRAGC